MQPSIHISKIIPPRNPQILQRARLIKQLDLQQDKKLILILGQAAQGKSTLAVSYVNACPAPSAWVNLSPEDAEAVNLFYLLGCSLQRVLPEADFAPALHYPAVTLSPQAEAPLYRDMLSTLLEHASGPVQIILDGLDRLSAGAPAFRFLQVLLDMLPPHLRLFILSREMPPVDIQKLAERKEVFRLTNADLAFTLGETTKYFQTIRKFHISSDLVQGIHRLTEGWIGGLVLFCDSLDWVPEGQRESYISQELAGKFIWNIFQYFGERILALLPREVQEFLLKSSILDIVEPDFVGEAMGLANAQEILEELVRRNLFVQSIYDEKRGWSFRYHQLFKEFLQAKFQSLLAREHQLESYYQAASLSERREDLETAVRYYLRARSYAKAASALEKVGLELTRLGKTAELARWLQNLPAAEVQNRPWLLYYHYLTGRTSGAPEYLSSLQRASGLFQERQDLHGLLLTSAHLLEVSAYLGLPSLPSTALLRQAEELLQRIDSRDFPAENAALWFQVSLAKMSGLDARQGCQACRQAHLLAKEAGERHLEIHALIYVKVILTSLGEFSAARKAEQQVETLLANWISPELQVHHLLSTGMLHGFQGEAGKYEALVKLAQEHVEKHGLTFLNPLTLLHRLMSLGYAGKYPEAVEAGLNLLNLPSSPATYLKGLAAMGLAAFSYHRNDLPAARQFAEKARQMLSSEESRSEYYLLLVKLISGLISYHLGELDPATEAGLQETLRLVTGLANYLFLVEAHWVLALWRWRQGRLEEARAHIQAGMKAAAQRGSYFSIILSPRDRGRILTLALELAAAEVWDQLPRLLLPLAGLVAPDLEQLSRHGNPKVAAQVWEIRRAIYRAGLPHLRLQTLGGFRLWRGESVVEKPEWEGHQPQLLLKAILARGLKGVPKEVLMEDLWPEALPEQAEKNFKINLHRLRKTLEPTMDKTFGSSYVHLKANLVSLDSELCQVDADQFLSLYNKGVKREEGGEIKGAISLYKEAKELYDGDYLAEELYHNWIEVKREELRGNFLDLLHRLARLYEGQGSVRKAIACYNKVVQTDHLAEPAYRSLMLLFAQIGMRNAALRTYQDCRQSMQRVLNMEPEEATRAIYRKILESVGGSGKVKSHP